MYTKPDATEYSSYFTAYISSLPEAPLLDLLHQQPVQLQELLSTVTDKQAETGYAPGKWSIKELLGHMVDTERIMAYRALCISRKEKQNLPGFDENQYVQYANFNQRLLAGLLQEFNLARQATILLFEHMTTEMAQCSGLVNNNPTTVNALAYIIAGHGQHHINILSGRYLTQ